MSKEVKIALISVLIILITIVLVFTVSVKTKNVETNEVAVENSEQANKEEVEEKEEQIKIFNGTDRPVAFMIDNNVNAQPQASINKAFIVYEIIVEGNESRLMAVFKGIEADSVGPIRSSRHYFLDYAMENDAIYAHLGMSPQAESDFSKFNINNINGQVYDTGKARTASSRYWRASHKKAPHNAYTNIESIFCNRMDK